MVYSFSQHDDGFGSVASVAAGTRPGIDADQIPVTLPGKNLDEKHMLYRRAMMPAS
jgi:hypothetical protein